MLGKILQIPENIKSRHHQIKKFRVSQNRWNPLIWWWFITETRNFISAGVSWCLIWILYGYYWRSFFKFLCNNAGARPISWERLRRDFFGFLPTESLIPSTSSGHLAVIFLPALGFSAFCWGFLLALWLEICVPNDEFGFSWDFC